MNRQLLIPVIVLDSLGALLIAFGGLGLTAAEGSSFHFLQAQGYAWPLLIAGGVLMVLAAPLIVVLLKQRQQSS
jgi:hypothetical protein